MPETNSFPEDILERIKEKEINAINREEYAIRLRKIWDEINLFFPKKWMLHCLDLLDKHDLFLEKIRIQHYSDTFLIEEIDFLRAIYRIVKEKADELKPHRFPAYLEKACKEANLRLDSDSRHPRYKFNNGFFQLNIDDRKKTASLANYESNKISEFPADIEAIVEFIQRENKRIFERPFDAKKFLKKIRSTYLAILKKEKLSDGTTIPIREITQRLGKNESGFRTDEFLIDLSKLIEMDSIEIDSYRLELQQTKETTHGMLLQIEPKRYFNLIFFKKV